MAVIPRHFLVHDSNYMEQSRRDYTRLVISLLLTVDGDVISTHVAMNAFDERKRLLYARSPDVLRIPELSFYESEMEKTRPEFFLSLLDTQPLLDISFAAMQKNI